MTRTTAPFIGLRIVTAAAAAATIAVPAFAQDAGAAQDKANQALAQLVERMDKVKSKLDPKRRCIFVDSEHRSAERHYNQGMTAGTPEEAKRHYEASLAASQEGLKKPIPRNCQ